MSDNDEAIRKKFLHFSDGEYDTTSGWHRLEAKRHRSNRKATVPLRLGIAASFMIIAVSAYFLFFKKPDNAPYLYAYAAKASTATIAKKAVAPSKKENTEMITANNNTPEKENKKTRLPLLPVYDGPIQREKEPEPNGNVVAAAAPAPRATVAPVQPTAPLNSEAPQIVSRTIATISAEEADRLMAETIGSGPKHRTAALRLSRGHSESSTGIEKSSSPTTLITF